jgi:hypothetical protein
VLATLPLSSADGDVDATHRKRLEHRLAKPLRPMSAIFSFRFTSR